MLDLWHEKDYVCIVFECYCEGDLFSLADAYPDGMPAQKAVQILRSTAAGLHHMHGRGVYHRDIKPENVMVKGQGTGEFELCRGGEEGVDGQGV